MGRKVAFMFRCGNREGLTESDPIMYPVTIVGQLDHLRTLKYSDVQNKLKPRVSKELFETTLDALNPQSKYESMSMYLKAANLLAVSSHQVSRNNTPSKVHLLVDAIRQTYKHNSAQEYIVLVCPKELVLPSVAGLSRAFPIFNMKTQTQGRNNNNMLDLTTINVEILVIDRRSGVLDALRLSDDELQTLRNVSMSVRNAARLVDTPCNILNVDTFVQEATSVYDQLLQGGKPVSMMVIKDEELLARGFGGLHNVGKAADHPPALVVLSYTPTCTKGKKKKNIAWVGKGIVFDSGGLSLKPTRYMEGMKRDCGGAVGILYAFELAVREGFTDDLHAVLCLAENSVSSVSMRVDDVITLYSGKSVEVNDTDAEGRLVLGDGVAFAKKDLGCEIILDMATLTGAQGIATGLHHGALLTNREEYEQKGVLAGRASGDLVFPIVYAPDLHAKAFHSSIADMKNLAGKSGSSCAGLFVLSHIGMDFPGTFIHIDMAYPVFNDERGTGYGVMLLNTLFGKSFPESCLFHGIAPD